MFLLEPGRTPYDLSWRMFGTNIRVHPMFWLFSAILGWNWIEMGMGYLLLWIVCTFVSILVHEFGHVFAGRIFGRSSDIVLYSFGGLAIGSTHLPHRWQRVIVCLAGPAAGLALWGGVVAFFDFGLPLLRPDPKWAEQWLYLIMALSMLRWMNLAWSLLNLLPIWPLDGGQVSREVLAGVLPGRGIRLSLGISFLLAAVLALHSIMAQNNRPLIPWLPIGGTYTAILFAMLAIQSFQLLQQMSHDQRSSDQDDSTPWERDPNIWRR